MESFQGIDTYQGILWRHNGEDVVRDLNKFCVT